MLVAHSPIYLANYPVDMRKSINGLMLIIHSEFGHNPTSGAYYIFCNRACDKLKVLYWDTNGFALWYKRLEKHRFQFRYRTDQRLELNADQFQYLLSGLPWYQYPTRQKLQYQIFA